MPPATRFALKRGAGLIVAAVLLAWLAGIGRYRSVVCVSPLRRMTRLVVLAGKHKIDGRTQEPTATVSVMRRPMQAIVYPPIAKYDSRVASRDGIGSNDALYSAGRTMTCLSVKVGTF
jgi:hypothetical protein